MEAWMLMLPKPHLDSWYIVIRREILENKELKNKYRPKANKQAVKNIQLAYFFGFFDILVSIISQNIFYFEWWKICRILLFLPRFLKDNNKLLSYDKENVRDFIFTFFIA